MLPVVLICAISAIFLTIHPHSHRLLCGTRIYSNWPCFLVGDPLRHDHPLLARECPVCRPHDFKEEAKNGVAAYLELASYLMLTR